MCIRQVELLTAIEAHRVRALFDREHAADVAVPTAKHKLDDT